MCSLPESQGCVHCATRVWQKTTLQRRSEVTTDIQSYIAVLNLCIFLGIRLALHLSNSLSNSIPLTLNLIRTFTPSWQIYLSVYALGVFRGHSHAQTAADESPEKNLNHDLPTNPRYQCVLAMRRIFLGLNGLAAVIFDVREAALIHVV